MKKDGKRHCPLLYHTIKSPFCTNSYAGEHNPWQPFPFLTISPGVFIIQKEPYRRFTEQSP